MKVAIAQLNPTIGDLSYNTQQILSAAQTAAAQGARLLLTPELSLCGYPPRDLLMQPAFVAEMAAMLTQLAQALPTEIAVLVGTVTPNPHAFQTGGKPLFNSTALLQNGQVEQFFHKRLLPTYDVFDEDRYFEPSSETRAFTLDGVRIGVTICEDLWNDETFWGKRNYAIDPLAELVAAGVDLIVNLSASPYSVSKQQLREAILRQATQTYGQPILYANQVGGTDDLACENLVIRRFTPHLIQYLERADLSISLGGYNTTMNILRTGVRSLIFPAASEEQTGEQTIRAEKLAQQGILDVLTTADLQPERLAEKILTVLQRPPASHSFDLQGADKSTARIKQLLNNVTVAA
ncbi:nitrilase-related carbon-nitrogen hydrolase [Leptolyngbya sp. 7M]|uniref:nitrilase-related carbon-nitrogen hydrolase n=1 Tax=Leptolyngbya sp. 7M TaxID=2812896 RepID=UPI001B8B39D2|nr:nitrilase-related carbon-nitrogen hydrolase [Leptolyngbya sp. 7M]QYO64092.1 hypothetical protein JVX88_30730 [Leptolyngbya sp. 7M]